MDSSELGSGAFNTVTLLKLKDGAEWVFKPEMPGCLTTSFSSHYHGIAKNMEFTRVNLAVQDTANRLGLNDVMVTTKAGTHKGRFGMFMEKAPGLTGKKYLKANDEKVGEGKVYTAEQWETHDIQKTVAKAALWKARNHPALPSANIQYAEAVKIRSDYVGSTNFFMRDFYESVTSRGYHTNWFE